MPDFIAQVIKELVEKATIEEFAEAQTRIEKRKAEIVATVMLSIHKHMTLEKFGEHITITVKIAP